MIGALLAALLAAAVPGSNAGRTATMHASGSFEVTVTPEAQAAAPEGGVPTSRMALAKTFSGGLSGRATGTMLAAGALAPGQAASYVAVDQFTGTLDGRAGSFVLLHRGTMTRAGGGALEVVVAEDSGTGALEGLEGTLAIRIEGGRHLYDFAYTLPAPR